MRRRETLDIPATPANLKYAGRLRAEVINAIERGTFDYAATFPESKFARLSSPIRKRYLVNECVQDYIDTARKTKSQSPSSILTYTKWNRARISPYFVGKYLDDLTTPDIKAWIAEIATALSPKSVRNCVGILSTVLSTLHHDGVIKDNPIKPIKIKNLLPKATKKSEDDDIDPFNREEIAAILNFCQRPQDKALFQFAFSTGMRTGELIALKWKHIDWVNNLIHVGDNIVNAEGGTFEKTTKTDKERDIPMLPAAKEALLTMKPITSMLKNGDYIFSYDGKNRWRDGFQIRNRWVITLKLAKVRYRYPYQTRHTFASTLLMNGEPELLVATLLGHATVDMIRKHYGKFIKPTAGIKLLSDYAEFGAHLGQSNPSKAA